jgi:hypothetical protein
MYKLQMDADATLTITGVPVDVPSHPISLISGWNWLGYLPQNPGDVGMALASLGDNAEFINSQSSGVSTNFGADNGWFGSLETLDPGNGYLLKMIAPDVLTYPEFDGLSRLAANKEEVILSSKISNWDFHYGDYEFIGTITASIDNRNDAFDDVVGVFVDDKCRGIAKRMYFPLDDSYYYIIQLHYYIPE